MNNLLNYSKENILAILIIILLLVSTYFQYRILDEVDSRGSVKIIGGSVDITQGSYSSPIRVKVVDR
jgi:hypothetical protein